MAQQVLATVDYEEIEHFRTLSDTWWDEQGPYKGLHQLNPLRIEYILSHIQTSDSKIQPLKNLSILDIGCGGGLLCEPMARLGAEVKGIDAAFESIEVAKVHAKDLGLNIDYSCSTAEEEQGRYDVVLCMEIIEHVANLSQFIEASTRLVRPGGLIFYSSLNRTWKSYLLGIVAAEHILRWVPKGTHQWEKFVKPKELKELLLKNKVQPLNQTGVIMDPLKGQWTLSPREGVNYMMVGQKDS